MLLVDIRNYVELMGSVDLSTLSRHFKIPESALQDMMGHWIRKGDIKMINSDLNCATTTCGGCNQGDCASNSIKYVWQRAE